MRILIAICLMLKIMAPPPAKADLNASDRVELNKVIEDFIRNNAEVVRDTLIALAPVKKQNANKPGLPRCVMIWATRSWATPMAKSHYMNFPIIIVVLQTYF